MKINRTSAFVIITLFSLRPCIGQYSNAERNERVERWMDRLDIMYDLSPSYHFALKYQDRERIHRWLNDSSTLHLENIDAADLKDWLMNFNETTARLDSTISAPSSQRKGGLSAFYHNPQHLLTVHVPNFSMSIDPLLMISLGKEINNDVPIIQNTRGLRIRGRIDNKIYFHTEILETQRSFQTFLTERIEEINAIPGQGFYRDFSSKIFNNWQGYDYLNSQAHIGFKLSTSIDFQLGHGRQFIGHGMRSMLLSDFAHNYFYARLSTQVWKFHYQNIFTELSSVSGKQLPGNIVIPKKYMAAHYLDFNVSPNFSIGFYEAVIFSRSDRFELQYLNPVILYRSVELMLDSPDNVLIGLNSRLNIASTLQLYSQVMVDELKISELFAGNGWWGNKIAFQFGLKYPSAFGVTHWDIQAEYNAARPFTYTHRVTDASNQLIPSYSHYNQALAHPLGAKFKEWILRQHFRPHRRLGLRSDLYFIQFDQGEGHDILTSYEKRTRDLGYYILESERASRWILDLNADYELFPNYFLTFQYRYQRAAGAPLKENQPHFVSFGISANLWQDALAY